MTRHLFPAATIAYNMRLPKVHSANCIDAAKPLCTVLQVVSNGGIAADTQAPDIVYVSSKTQRVIWRVDLKARKATQSPEAANP